MINILRADSRRLVRSKSFYIILAITAGILIFLNFMVALVSSPEFLKLVEQSGGEVTVSDVDMAEELQNMSQLDFTHECLSSGSLLILVGLGMTMFVNSDFAGGYIKNICFARPRRWEYVASKVIAAGAYSGILTLLGVALTLVLPYIFGLHPAASGVWEILQYIFWLWLPHWAFALMTLAAVLATRGVALGITASIICGGGLPAALVNALAGRLGLPHAERCFLSTLVAVNCSPQSGMNELLTILACAAVWGVLYTAVSLLLMMKRDI